MHHRTLFSNVGITQAQVHCLQKIECKCVWSRFVRNFKFATVPTVKMDPFDLVFDCMVSRASSKTNKR